MTRSRIRRLVLPAMGVALLFATGCSSDFGGRQNPSGEDEPDVAAPSQPPASTEDAVDPAELVVTGGPILTMDPVWVPNTRP